MYETFQEAVQVLLDKYAFHPDCKATLVALTAAHEAEVAGLRDDLGKANAKIESMAKAAEESFLRHHGM